MFGRLIVKKTCYCLKSPLSANYQIFIPQSQKAAAAQGGHGSCRSSEAAVPPQGGPKHPLAAARLGAPGGEDIDPAAHQAGKQL